MISQKRGFTSLQSKRCLTECEGGDLLAHDSRETNVERELEGKIVFLLASRLTLAYSSSYSASMLAIVLLS